MKTREYKVSQFISHFVLAVASLFVLIPFVLLIVASFTDNAWATANGFTFLPGKFSLEAYKYIWIQWDMIGKAYLMTIIVTFVGTGLSIIITTLMAYAVSRDDVPGMRLINFMIIFSMLFNGGLVATYYSYVNLLHIRDQFWALIIPSLLMNAFSIILVKNYFKNSIPASLIEAAHLDGAGVFRVFFSIVMPLSKPILATIGLMTGLMYWNDWANGLYYLTPRDGSKFYTIQIILNNINANIQTLLQNANMLNGAAIKMPSTTIRMAIATVGILPILVIYPFFQRYFIKGITLGGVKE